MFRKERAKNCALFPDVEKWLRFEGKNRSPRAGRVFRTVLQQQIVLQTQASTSGPSIFNDNEEDGLCE